MRCPPDARSSFLMIAVQNFSRGILSVEEGDRVLISITRKTRDHGSPQSEKKAEKIKGSKTKTN
jgi:hypothetical protein